MSLLSGLTGLIVIAAAFFDAAEQTPTVNTPIIKRQCLARGFVGLVELATGLLDLGQLEPHARMLLGDGKTALQGLRCGYPGADTAGQ